MTKRKEWLVPPTRKERIGLCVGAVIMLVIAFFLFLRTGADTSLSAFMAVGVAAIQLIVAKFGVPTWLCD